MIHICGSCEIKVIQKQEALQVKVIFEIFDNSYC